MPDFIYENMSTGQVYKLSGTPPVNPVGEIPGGSYRVHLLGSAAAMLAQVPHADRLGIVCWGDSLTAGAGAAPNSTYPAQASLPLPDYKFFNRGVGGQTSTQIATRSGAMPITVGHPEIAEVVGNPNLSRELRFAGGPDGWSSALYDGDGLYWVTPGGVNVQVNRQLGFTIPAGKFVRMKFKVTEFSGSGPISLGLQTGSAWASGQNAFSAAGTFELLSAVTADASYITLYRGSASTGETRIRFSMMEFEVLDALPTAVEITKNTNILYNGGSYAGSMRGRIGGVYGIINTDASGNWTFTRREPGPLVPAREGQIFIRDDLEDLWGSTQWLWLGRNDPTISSVTAALAAMIGKCGHDRYLVAGVILGEADTVGSSGYNQIVALNAHLAGLYGPRYVDIQSGLNAAANSIRDAADIAGGNTPRSLRVDNIHLNAKGYGIVAKAFVAAHKAMGW